VTPAEALQTIRDAGLRNLFFISAHARDQMARRGAQIADIRHGLESAQSCSLQPNGRWRVSTADLDGDQLVLIVVFDPDTFVVTVF